MRFKIGERVLAAALVILAALNVQSLAPTGAYAANLVAVSYTGPSNGLWSSASNWSTGVVPANTDSDQFSVTIAANPIIFDRVGATTINDLVLTGSLQLNANCNLAVANQFSPSSASLTANGGNFVVDGPATTATNLSLTAASGAQVVLPALTQIAENAYAYGSLQANGTNSLLDLSQVTILTVDNIYTTVKATSGGKVDLRNLASITSTSESIANFNAAGGTIDLSSLAVATDNCGVNIALSSSGSVLWGSPTSLSRVALSLTGAGNSIDLSQVATAANISLTAAGGAQVVLPALTQLAENAYAYGSLQATGANSLLDLSHVTTLAVDNIHTSVQASSGGKVDLRNLASITSTSENIAKFSASGGTIDLSSLAVATANSGVNIVLSNSGTVTWGSPTSLSRVALSLTGAGNSIDLSQVATAANVSLTAVNGAQVVLPALTQLAENAYAYGALQANGANSLLDLSHVTTLAVDNIHTSVQASSGGKVDLRNLLSITSTSENIAKFNASGGTIDLSSLAVATANSGVNITLSNSGTVTWGSPTSLSRVALSLTGAGNSIDLSQVATAANVSLTAVNGAQVVLPALTQIAENAYAYGSLQANGANSLLDLSHVTTLVVDNIFTTVQASSGGKVDLRNLLSITSTSGNIANFNASGGTIDVSKLSPNCSNIQVRSGGSLLIGAVNLHNGSATLSDAGSTLTIQGDLSTDATSSLSISNATAVIEGSFLNGITSETRMAASSAIVQIIGSAPHTLEVAGLNLGAINPGNNGNFGLGQLVLGQAGSPATLTLTDFLDNGNRSGGPEALYLFGSGGSNGLSLMGGSTLVLNHLEAYDYINGNWVSLQSLLGGNNSVPFDGGYLVQQAVPEPSTFALLVAGAIAGLLWRKRRR